MNKSDLKDGMTLVYRNGCKVDYYKGYLLDFESEGIGEMDLFNDDLTHKEHDFWDVCKIIENDSVVWEREEVDWSKVPFGTKVRCWRDINNKFEGKFLGYDEGINMYVVFVSVDRRTDWECCELVEDPKEEVTYNEMMKSIDGICNKYYKKNKSCCGCVAYKSNCYCSKSVLIDENFIITKK